MTRKNYVKPVKTVSYDNSTELECFQGASRKPKDETLLQALPSYLENRIKKNDSDSGSDVSKHPAPKDEEESEAKKVTIRTILYELKNRHSFINVDQHLYVYIENEGYWKLILPNDNNRELRWLIPEEYMEKVNKNFLYELYEWLLRYSNYCPSEIFRTGRHCLNFSDFAYDWKEKKIVEHRKPMYFRYSLKIDYKQPKKSSGKFRELIEDTFQSDDKLINEFQKFFALALSPIRSLKLAVYLLGPSNTSKSVMLEFLRALAGPENCSSLSFSKMNNDFAVAQLLGSRLNLSGESSGTSSVRLDTFKALTGNDSNSACFKNKDFFSFQNMAFLVFATNVLPEIKEVAEAESFLSRLLIFPMRRVVKRENWSFNLVNKIIREDSAGIVDFIIEGMQKLDKDDYVFHPTESMEEAKLNYYGQYDSFSLFAKKYIEADHKSRLSSAEIAEAYKLFCDKHFYVELKSNQWSTNLEKLFFCKRGYVKRTVNGSDSQVRGYIGIKFNKKVNKLYKIDEKSDEETDSDDVITDTLEKIYGTNQE